MDAEAVKARGAAQGLRIIRESTSIRMPGVPRREWMLAKVTQLSVGDNIAGRGLIHSIERDRGIVVVKAGVDQTTSRFELGDEVFAFTTGREASPTQKGELAF